MAVREISAGQRFTQCLLLRSARTQLAEKLYSCIRASGAGVIFELRHYRLNSNQASYSCFQQK